MIKMTIFIPMMILHFTNPSALADPSGTAFSLELTSKIDVLSGKESFYLKCEKKTPFLWGKISLGKRVDNCLVNQANPKAKFTFKGSEVELPVRLTKGKGGKYNDIYEVAFPNGGWKEVGISSAEIRNYDLPDLAEMLVKPLEVVTPTCPLLREHRPLPAIPLPVKIAESQEELKAKFSREYFLKGMKKRKKLMNEMCTTEMVLANNISFVLDQMNKYPMLFDESHDPFIGDGNLAKLKPQLEKVVANSRQYGESIARAIASDSSSDPFNLLAPPENYFKEMADYVTQSQKHLQKVVQLSQEENGQNYREFLQEFKTNRPPNIPFSSSPSSPASPTLDICFNHPSFDQDPAKGADHNYSGGNLDFSTLLIQPAQRGPRLDIFVRDISKSFGDSDDIKEKAAQAGLTDPQTLQEVEDLIKGKGEARSKHPETLLGVQERILAGNKFINEAQRETERRDAIALFPDLARLTRKQQDDFLSNNTPNNLKKDYVHLTKMAGSYGVDFSAIDSLTKGKISALKGDKRKFAKMVNELLEKDPDKYLIPFLKNTTPETISDFTNPQRTSANLRKDYFFWVGKSAKYDVDYTQLSLAEKTKLAKIGLSNQKKIDHFFQSLKKKKQEKPVVEKAAVTGKDLFRAGMARAPLPSSEMGGEQFFRVGLARNSGVDYTRIPPSLRAELDRIPNSRKDQFEKFFSKLKKDHPEAMIQKEEPEPE